mmetsp:Transcript_19763/g.42851  ORF Transcript_19763/g.42851 Transcript_19763/m.42851 type:complete len:248 (+) Transcript_19763:3-746(+)
MTFPQLDNLRSLEKLGKAAISRAGSLADAGKLGARLPNYGSLSRSATLTEKPSFSSPSWAKSSHTFPTMAQAVDRARSRLTVWSRHLKAQPYWDTFRRYGFRLTGVEAFFTRLSRARLLVKVFLFSSVSLVLLYPTVVLAQHISWLFGAAQSLSSFFSESKGRPTTTTSGATATITTTPTTTATTTTAPTEAKSAGVGLSSSARSRGEDMGSWLFGLPGRWFWENSNRRWAREMEALATLTSWHAWS